MNNGPILNWDLRQDYNIPESIVCIPDYHESILRVVGWIFLLMRFQNQKLMRFQRHNDLRFLNLLSPDLRQDIVMHSYHGPDQIRHDTAEGFYAFLQQY